MVQQVINESINCLLYSPARRFSFCWCHQEIISSTTAASSDSWIPSQHKILFSKQQIGNIIKDIVNYKCSFNIICPRRRYRTTCISGMIEKYTARHIKSNCGDGRISCLTAVFPLIFVVLCALLVEFGYYVARVSPFD